MTGFGRCRNCRAVVWWGANPRKPGGVLPFDDKGEQTLHFETCSATEWLIDELGNRQRISECKTCGSKVWWQTTPTGAHRPMDVEPGPHNWRECHFDTCAGVRPETERVGAGRVQEAAPVLTGVRAWVADLGLSYPPLPSEAAITAAFRSLSMRHHPDMGGRAEDFIRIKMARDGLKAMVTA